MIFGIEFEIEFGIESFILYSIKFKGNCKVLNENNFAIRVAKIRFYIYFD